MPVSSGVLSGHIFIRKNSNKHIFNWEFEVIEKEIKIGLIHRLFLSSVDSYEIETDSLDIKVVNSGMSENIINK